MVAFLMTVTSKTASAQTSDTINGWFAIIWGDGYPSSGKEAIRYTVTDHNRHTTMLSMDKDTALPSGGILSFNGKYVEIQGERVSSLSDQGVTSEMLNVTSIVMLASPLPEAAADTALAVTGSKPWVSIMCKFSDYTDEPNNIGYFQTMYANVKPGLDHYWRELSYNTVNIAGSNAFGWFTLPHPESYYNPSDTLGGTDLSLLAEDCIAAADNSVNFPSYSGINMMFNTNFDNGYAWGGTEYLTLDGVAKSWSITWEPPWGYSSITVIAHEMGHGFGLPHSSGAYGETYDNIWDVMSDGWANCTNSTDTIYGCLGQHTIAYHKDRLGWIPSDKKYSGVGTIAIDNLALLSTTNYRMAEIPINGSQTHFYTVEVRDRSGYDIKLPDKAVIIHEVDTTRERPAYVIDPDGNGDTGDEGAMWKVGETFVDNANGISVQVVSSTSTGFNVSINQTPYQPKNVSATKGSYPDKVEITWSSVTNADSYRIYRCTSSSTSTCAEIYSGSTTGYEDVSAAGNTVYYYRIKACDNSGCSEYSEYSTGYFKGTIVPDALPAVLNLLLNKL